MNKNERKILSATCFAHFLSHYNMLVFPALVLPLAARLGIDMAQCFALSFWMYLLYGLSALPWGMAADRWGPRPLLVVFHAGAALSSLLAALYVDSPRALLIFLTMLGLFSGIYHPVGMGLISKHIRRISMGLAVNGMVGNLGIALAPLLTGIAVWAQGPEAAFLLVAALNGAGTVLAASFSGTAHADPADSADDSGTINLPAFAVLLGAIMLCGLAYRGATVSLPSYFELKNVRIFESLTGLFGSGLTPNLVATATVSLLYIIGIAGQYTGGRIAERFDLRWCYLLFHAVPVPVAFAMAYAADLPLVLLGTVYVFFLLGMQPIENTLIARFTPSRFRHSAYGTKFILTFGVGAGAVKLIEVIQDTWGMERVFTGLGFVSLSLTAVILLLIFTTKPQR